MGEEDAKRGPKPIEQWGAEEWKTAYNQLSQRHEKLRAHMQLALQQLSKAI